MIKQGPPGFKHQSSKTILQSLAACQVSYIREVEGITIFTNDEVTRIGKCLSKVKLDTEVALFYKLKIITRAVVWRQVETQNYVARAIISSIYFYFSLFKHYFLKCLL